MNDPQVWLQPGSKPEIVIGDAEKEYFRNSSLKIRKTCALQINFESINS